MVIDALAELMLLAVLLAAVVLLAVTAWRLRRIGEELHALLRLVRERKYRQQQRGG